MHAPSEVREQLDRVLNSRALAGSEQLKKLLRVTVERSLEGQAESTKEYTLGVEALGRPETYDPKVDPIVRVQARRLRTKLQEYYSGEGASDPLVIEMPKGGYVPAFRSRGNSPQPSRRLVVGILPGAAVAIGTAYWLTRPKKAGGLTVAVLPLRNLTGDPGKQYLADKSTEALVTNLARTGALNVVSSTTTRRYATSSKSLPEIAAEIRARWVVEGGMAFERGRAMMKLRVVDATSDQKIWADSFQSDEETLSTEQAKAADGISAAIRRAATER
jgi:TolB-like protein